MVAMPSDLPCNSQTPSPIAPGTPIETETPKRQSRIENNNLSNDLYISWEEYHRAIERLACSVHQSGWAFDQIVCLARGGLRVGDIFSRLFHKPLAILFASSYAGELGRERGQLKFAQSLAMTGDRLGPRVLVVDDLADSGATLEASIQWLRDRYDLSDLRTAVIWYKGCSSIAPDYYDCYLPHNPWIHQPFERYDVMELAELASSIEAD
jgi:hypothetical protein